MPNCKTLCLLTLLVALSLPVTGCMPAVGRPFPVQQVRQIEIGQTTQADVHRMFGEPWRTGIEDGFRTWSYGEHSLQNSRELVIRFTEKNVVKSYNFSSSYPEDRNL